MTNLQTATPIVVTTIGITDYINLKGSVVELDRRELFPKYMSKIIDVQVCQGDSVSKGDILMTLEVQDGSTAAPVFYSELKGYIKTSGLNETGSMETGLPYDSQGLAGEQYYIISPIDGVVMDIYSQRGDMVSGVFPCIAVSDMSRLGVKADISESNITKVAQGMSCLVTMPALSDVPYAGSITTIAPYASASSILDQSGDVKTELYAEIKSPGDTIRPGYSAELKITLGTDSNRIVLPYNCIGQDDKGEYVLTLNSSMILEKSYVTTSRELAEGMEITSGIEVGNIVVENPDSYHQGERVCVN